MGEGKRRSLPPLSEGRIQASRKAGKILVTGATPTELIEAIASEMSVGVDRAVECWMAEIEQALTDIHLTSLGRLNAVCEIVNGYKQLTGKAQLRDRSVC